MQAAEKGISVAEVDNVQAVSLGRVTSKELKAKRSSLVRRLFMWKRV